MANQDRMTKKYICSYCLKQYDQWQDADACRDGHDLIYVQISKYDLNRLLMFIQLKEDSLLTKTLIHSLYKYRAGGLPGD